MPWTGGVCGLALDATASRLAAGGDVARVVDLAKDTRRDTFAVRGGSVLAFSPDGQILAGSDHALIHLDGKTKRNLLTGHRNQIRTLAFAPDSQWLASGADDGKIIVWDAAQGTKKWEFDAHEGSVAHLAFAADGRLLASAGGTADPTLRVWDLAAGTEKTTLDANYAGIEFISGIVLSPDGKQIVVCHNSRELDVWDVASGKLSRHLVGHANTPHMTIAPLGRDRFATADQDKVLVWSWTKIAHVPPDFRRPRPTRVAAASGFTTMLRRVDGVEKVRNLRSRPAPASSRCWGRRNVPSAKRPPAKRCRGRPSTPTSTTPSSAPTPRPCSPAAGIS